MFGGEVEMLPALRGERTRGQADTTKARELGWAPQHDLPTYIADYKASLSLSR